MCLFQVPQTHIEADKWLALQETREELLLDLGQVILGQRLTATLHAVLAVGKHKR